MWSTKYVHNNRLTIKIYKYNEKLSLLVFMYIYFLCFKNNILFGNISKTIDYTV